MTRQSIAAFRRLVTVDWPGQRDADARRHLIAVARCGHAEILRAQQARGGVAPAFEVYANRPGRPVEQVELPGPIVYHYRYFAEIVTVALAALLASGLSRDALGHRNRHPRFSRTPDPPPFGSTNLTPAASRAPRFRIAGLRRPRGSRRPAPTCSDQGPVQIGRGTHAGSAS